jgi:hypothetical protein
MVFKMPIAMVLALALQAAPQLETIDHVTIAAMSTLPPPSGFLATYVTVLGVVEGAQPTTVYIPYFGQALPSVSSLCRFDVSKRDIPSGPQQARRQIVEKFRCEITSESPPIPQVSQPDPLID